MIAAGKKFALVPALLLMGGGLAVAQSTSKPSAVKPTQTLALHIDAEQTKVEWTIGVTLHKVHGTLKMNGGQLIADPKTGVAQGEIEIDTASLSTGDEKRDTKWKQDVLESGRYPAIIFHPVSVMGLKEGDGEQTVKAKGTVTLHGSDHPVELELHLQVSGKQATVTTHFVVPYVEWGLKNPSSGFTRYDKEVSVDITAKGTLEEKSAVVEAPQPGNS